MLSDQQLTCESKRGRPMQAIFIALSCCLLAWLGGCTRPAIENKDESDDASDAVVVVKTVEAQVGSVADTIAGIGRCEALPNRLVNLTPAVEGRVDKIAVRVGERVEQGQPIIELDATIARATLAEKQSSRDALSASLDSLQAPPRDVDRKGSELAVEQAKLAVERSKAAVERLRPLRARNEVSEAQMFEAEQALAVALVQQKSAEAQLQLLLAGPRPESIAEAKARLAEAEQVVANAQEMVELRTIRSPIEGVVDSLNCHPGQTVSAGASLGEIVDRSEVHATVWMPPRHATRVQVGQSAEVRPGDTPSPAKRAADPASPASAMPGEVVSIGHVVDPQTGNLPVRIHVENQAGTLSIGQMVQVSILVEKTRESLIVPAVAIIDLSDGPVVTVVRDGKTVQLHPESLTIQRDRAVISGGGLHPGESVVVEGGFNLPEGTAVKVEPAKSVAQPDADAQAESKDRRS